MQSYNASQAKKLLAGTRIDAFSINFGQQERQNIRYEKRGDAQT
jgi:hypothetical protein